MYRIVGIVALNTVRFPRKGTVDTSIGDVNVAITLGSSNAGSERFGPFLFIASRKRLRALEWDQRFRKNHQSGVECSISRVRAAIASQSNQ